MVILLHLPHTTLTTMPVMCAALRRLVTEQLDSHVEAVNIMLYALPAMV